MSLILDPIGLVGVAAGLVALALAAWVYSAAPQRSANRRLGILLLVEGLLASTVAGTTYLTSDPALAGAWRQSAVVPALLSAPAYLTFLSTLPTPLVRWLDRGAVLVGAWTVAVVAIMVALAVPGALRIEAAPFGSMGAWEASWTGPMATVAFGGITLVNLLGLVVALDVLRRAARGTPARTRARIYALAFGIRDLLTFVVLGSWFINDLTPDEVGFGDWDVVLPTIGGLVMLTLLPYGLLRYQIFDIDIRLKRGISRGVLASIFVAIFFIVSEGAAAFIESRTGSTAIGIVAAGALLFLITPMQRLADLVSNAAMPNVRDTEEYRLVRKREVYLAAVGSALEDGLLTERERSVLATLADELGITSRDALDLERKAIGGQSATDADAGAAGT